MQTTALYENFFGRKPIEDDFEITKSQGSFIYDAQGKKYIDFLMGWCVGNLGWDHLEIKPLDIPSYVYPQLMYKPWGELAQLLASITPGHLKKCFRTTGGTEAVDAAMQIAMCFTQRHKFMSIEGSYHGNSLSTISLGSSLHKNTYKNLLAHCYKIEPPLDQTALQKIERRLKRKDIAAFIMEPIICNLGVLIPSKGFMTSLQALCRKYGTLLIIDEVATGFCRTGKLFAAEHFDLEPDIMTLAKAITNGYASLGAVITTETIADSVSKKIEETPNLYATFLYSTYGWHPFSTHVAIATVKFIINNKTQLLSNVHEMSDLFQTRLEKMAFKTLPKINIQGLAIGVNTGDIHYARQIKTECKKKGLIIDADGPNLMLFPALTIDKQTAEEGLNILETSIQGIKPC
jgi:adenosylmethionine-8-amino-7-oxononanoate aminotransferase